MKKNKILVLLLIVAAVVAGGIWGLDYFKNKTAGTSAAVNQRAANKYWTCAMHPSVRSDKPGKCPICGMELIPVEKKQESKATQEQEPVDKDAYYGCGVKEFGHCPRCDEGKPDAKCICGEHKFMVKGEKMLCPVCKRDLKKLSPKETPGVASDSAGELSLTKRQEELSGIATSMVMKENSYKEIRTVGKIAYDPELTITQEEFLIALDTLQKVRNSPDKDVIDRAEDLVEKSKFRLKLLGMSEEQIKELEENKESQRNLILPEGRVWVYADVYEYELSWIKEAMPVKVTAQAYPGEEFQGTIKAINPVLDPNTRSVRVRFEIDDPAKKLRPEMFVDVFIQASLGESLVVLREAILDTGTRKIVWVDKGNGSFQAREIKTGPEGFTLVDNQRARVFPVLSGLSEHEYVVTKGNFLLDSQSQLTGGMSLQWGGAAEIKKESESGKEAPPVSTQHKH